MNSVRAGERGLGGLTASSGDERGLSEAISGGRVGDKRGSSWLATCFILDEDRGGEQLGDGARDLEGCRVLGMPSCRAPVADGLRCRSVDGVDGMCPAGLWGHVHLPGAGADGRRGRGRWRGQRRTASARRRSSPPRASLMRSRRSTLVITFSFRKRCRSYSTRGGHEDSPMA